MGIICTCLYERKQTLRVRPTLETKLFFIGFYVLYIIFLVTTSVGTVWDWKWYDIIYYYIKIYQYNYIYCVM